MTYIFGIGRSSSAKILDKAGIDRDLKVKDWTDDQAAKIREIINACTCCRLGLCDGERAYIVPLNFGFVERDGHYTLYFHSAREGRKMELLRKTAWAAFEMDRGHELIEGAGSHSCSARYQCVMGGGPVTLPENREEKIEGLRALMLHDTGTEEWTFEDAMVDRTAVIRLEAEELTCKVRA